jgi:hypothetical protein
MAGLTQNERQGKALRQPLDGRGRPFYSSLVSSLVRPQPIHPQRKFRMDRPQAATGKLLVAAVIFNCRRRLRAAT